MGRTICDLHTKIKNNEMKFVKEKLDGLYTIELDKLTDDRGWFARTYCQAKFKEEGLVNDFIQASLSFNSTKGTLRGLHYQVAPHEETKLVQCLNGKSHHVLVDLRPKSSSYKQSTSIELSDQSHRIIYVPSGLAHGFITLADNTLINYQMDQEYRADSARTIAWNDPQFQISWPLEPIQISDKDKQASNFNE